MAKIRKPQQSRSKQTVTSIVEAGFIAVARDGSDGLGTRKVADIAGVSVGTLYEYFANKEEILDAMNQQFANDVVAMVQPLIPELTRMPPRDAVRTLQFAFRDLLQRDNGRYLNCARWLGRQFPSAHVEPVKRVLSDLAMQYLSHNPQYARLPNIPVMAYIIIQGGIASMISQLSEDNPTISFDQLAEGLADMVGYMIEGGMREVELRGQGPDNKDLITRA
ncbi:TetR/AcrR family transcriptional regulator [Alcanivorax sp. JB21]|uniref:TetR/AcrR family transcriptional regulator n=1 Tax=Alcanivorax limicola TaxID=2874102 RepID=UPI001CBBAB8A|nr:TetR/AcrR family transcriptional regulator [Alcanivorax limicola]MBZ2190544.1 TetR/AcrR family transcriptional regulator [Alcanivorax limicola]